MSNKKINETKNLFAGLSESKKEETKVDTSTNAVDSSSNVDVTVSKNVNNGVSENIVNDDSLNKNLNKTDDIFGSLLENDNVKEDYVRGTHYFRQDQLNDIAKFAKKAKKGKS